MAILRYNQQIADYIQCKVKPEPWLHIATIPIRSYFKAFKGKSTDAVKYVIYVWDTRKIVATDIAPKGCNNATIIRLSKRANDNRMPLIGKTDYYIDQLFEPKQTDDIKRNLNYARREQSKISKFLKH